MRLLVNIDSGIDLPSGKHEPLGNEIEASDVENVDDLIRRGHLVAIEEPKESKKEAQPKKSGLGGEK